MYVHVIILHDYVPDKRPYGHNNEKLALQVKHLSATLPLYCS